MLDVLLTIRKSLLVGSVLTVGLFVGSVSWALVSRQQASKTTAERDAALSELQQLKDSAGQLAQIEGRLASARIEYTKVIQGWADAKAKIGSTQQELAALTKRLDAARDRVTQTGSLRPSEPPKKPAAPKL